MHNDQLKQVQEALKDALYEITHLCSAAWDGTYTPRISDKKVNEWRAALSAAPETQEPPVAWQSHFIGGEWAPCSKEHHEHVLANQKEWPKYETRELYAAPVQPASQESPCYCGPEFSLQIVSGGAAKEGLYGRITCRNSSGEYVDYVPVQPASKPNTMARMQHEAGDYWCVCSNCSRQFIGRKRCVICKVCDTSSQEECLTCVGHGVIDGPEPFGSDPSKAMQSCPDCTSSQEASEAAQEPMTYTVDGEVMSALTYIDYLHGKLAAQPAPARDDRPLLQALKDVLNDCAGRHEYPSLQRLIYDAITALQSQPAPEAGKAGGLSVKLTKMSESSGKVWWSVFLANSEDARLWDCHEIYSDAIKGRAEYEADNLKHFLGLGPKPDILAYETDAPEAAPIKDHVIAQAINELRDIAIQFHGTQQLRERIKYVVLPLLKGEVTEAAPSAPAQAVTDDWIYETYRQTFEEAEGCVRSAPKNLPPLVYAFARRLLGSAKTETGAKNGSV